MFKMLYPPKWDARAKLVSVPLNCLSIFLSRRLTLAEHTLRSGLFETLKMFYCTDGWMGWGD